MIVHIETGLQINFPGTLWFKQAFEDWQQNHNPREHYFRETLWYKLLINKELFIYVFQNTNAVYRTDK